MKAQVLYDAQNDGVISGDDMQEFFLQTTGEYSISGNTLVNEEEARALLISSLLGQEKNSPSMAGFVDEMKKKYSLP